jgi:transposase
MRGIYSSRGLEQACRENINFMYLLEGQSPPDHNTIARFRSEHLPDGMDNLLHQLVQHLMQVGEISFSESAVFIDGTKIEAQANRYKFVWKKAVIKHRAAQQAKIHAELPALLASVDLRYYVPEAAFIGAPYLKKLRKQLWQKIYGEQVTLVHGKGCRKSKLQRALESVQAWLRREKQYNYDLHICGDRNSYCKTDRDATFMRMKEDHMRNGQLKPGYNVNVASVSGYVVDNIVSADRTDTKTLIPFLEQLSTAKYPVKRVVVDAGYESEENYSYFEEHQQLSLFVKPSNYEQKKKAKYRTDIGRRENMAYDEASDSYTCANGKALAAICVKKTRSSAGYPIETTVYECSECRHCPLKEKCIRKGSSKSPIEARCKRLQVSKHFQNNRALMEKKIATGEGILLRMNRSIFAEGVFAFIKGDMGFRRFMLRGKANVSTEWGLLCVAYNILKLHYKIKRGRVGIHLIEPKTA